MLKNFNKTNNNLLQSNKKFQSLFMINAVIPNIVGLLFIIFFSHFKP